MRADRPDVGTRLEPIALRRLILEQSYRAGVGHIGPALSVADILAVLFSGPIRGVGTQDVGRDRFVLSKGHAALALYCALHLSGVISAEQLDTYCADGSLLGVHPEHQLPGVDFTTGSLGHGLGLAAGHAWAAWLQRSSARTYVLLSDAELDEGSTWEAVMFAGHHRLGGLVAVLDKNGQQAMGRTADVLDLGDVGAKFETFGWKVVQVDGHDCSALASAVDSSSTVRPHLVIADTVSGRGVSFMERKVEWHYLPLDDEHYKVALSEIEQ